MPSSTSAGRAWAGIAGVLVVGSALTFAWASTGAATQALDWQPALAASQPWRAWTAAFVHFSALHLGANALGAVLVALFGVAAEVPMRSVVAWLIAWPLTQAGLLLRPDLLHYGGLSGVLHAGVAVAAMFLVASGPGRRRWIGAATLVLVAVKVVGEAPWGPALRHPGGWDIAVAPFAHATGLLGGIVCAGVAEWLGRRAAARAARATP